MAAPREKTSPSIPPEKVSQSGEPSAPQGFSPVSGTSVAPKPSPARGQTVPERTHQASGSNTPRETTRKAPTHAEIELVAYEIYLQRGTREGNALEDWLQAERKLTQAFGDAGGESPEMSRAQNA